MTRIAFDTETTGLDLFHGTEPYLVTTCDENGLVTYWEWDVDPITRRPYISDEDKCSVRGHLFEHSLYVAHNATFDVKAMSVGDEESILAESHGRDWPWERTVDTLLAAHLLNSNVRAQPKDLATLALVYLGVDILPYEKRVAEATKQARTYVARKYPEWRLAKADEPDMPSVAGKMWKNDMWLLRAIAQEESLPSDHPNWSLVHEYANADSAVVLPIWAAMGEEIKRRGLERIFAERSKIPAIEYAMEERGITVSGERHSEIRRKYQAESEQAARKCVNIAASYDHELVLPKSGNNKSLHEFVFKKMQLPVVAKSRKTGQPSLNKKVLDSYMATLPERSREVTFIRSLREKRQRDTAVQYLDSYQRFWLPWIPVDVDPETGAGWYVLHPSLNPTGTNTLRWSSSNPNEQNISKQEGFNLRYCFGPAPGREWWSLDAKNIELRIPAYEAGEEEMIALFERPDDPPFFGSNHLLVFSILHPEMFEEHGADVKKVYASTWYQWTKNGNFAVQYGAMEESGTADAAYHVKGAQRKIQARFTNIAQLNQRMIDHAKEHGYIETMPDKTVDPERGYPLVCTLDDWGRIKPTVPLNYHVQGTAMWWMMKAMIRCQKQLDDWNQDEGRDTYWMVMQVHDELVFDFPYRPRRGNLPKIRKIRRLMEEGGKDIGIPTPVSVEYHPTNWSEGVSV